MRDDQDNQSTAQGNSDQIEKDEIVNLEQFQVGRASQDEKKDEGQDEMTARSDDAGYTDQENQFADGIGTQLDEEIDVPNRDELETDLPDDDEFDEEDEVED